MVFFCWFSLLNSALSAESLSQKNQQLKGVNSKIILLKKNLQLTESQKKQLSKTLKNTEYEITKIAVELQRLNRKKSQIEADLATSEKEQAKLNKNLTVQKKLLAQQLRATYQLGENEYFQLFLNQENPAKIQRLTIYFQYINQARLKTLSDIQAIEIAIKEKQKKGEEQIQALKHLTQKNSEQKVALQKNLQKRQQILKQLNQKIQTQSSKLKEYEADKKQLELLLERLKKVAAETPKMPTTYSQEMTTQTSNHFVWPTQGKLLNRASVPALKNELGIVILAPEGQSVVSVYPGKVVFADWLKGFGLLIIINHGHGFMTLYAYNEKLYQKRGNFVKTGELIAKVGHTGILPQNALYFEVRHNGKAVSPLQWLSSKK